MLLLSVVLCSLSLLIGSVHGAVQVPAVALANLLQPADPTTIQGQSIALATFTLTVITNTTHALVSFEIPLGGAQVGWIAVGFGTTMANSAMVIMWPNANNSDWVLSARTAPGWALPLTSATEYAGLFTQVEALDFISTDSGCRASFIRPLQFPSSQTIFPAGHDDFLTLSRYNDKQPLIFGSSAVRPATDDISSPFGRHDHHGVMQISLTEHYQADGTSSSSRDLRSTLIITHANMGIVTWVLLAPIGVLIPRFFRAHQRWLGYHGTLQGWIVLPLTAMILAFGLYGGGPAEDTLTKTHKFMGIGLASLVLVQVALGVLANRSPRADTAVSGHFGGGRTFNRSSTQVTHMLLGVTILIAGFTQVQVGLALYAIGTLGTLYRIVTLGCVGVFFLLFLSSLVELVRARHREGRSWTKAIFGLGRASASRPRVRINLRPMDDSRPSFVMESGPYADLKGQDDFTGGSTQRRRSSGFESQDHKMLSLHDEDDDTRNLVKVL